ncbi:MAG: phage tail protein [Weeksellaceae bacterium]
MNSIIPHSIQQPHVIAFDLLMEKRMNEIQLDALLVYIINTIDRSALYWLADQFDLLGYNGWKLADTDEKKRSLIKKGIELHRYKGTVWAIREALRTVGYPNATIQEHITHWAGFTIQLNVGDMPIDSDQIAEALEMVKAYKNVRSHLKGFEFKILIDDVLIITDDSYEAPRTVDSDTVFTGGDFRYNGEYNYNGEKNHSSDTDVLELTIN